MKTKSIYFFALGLIFISCSNENTNDTTEETKEKVCTYAYDATSTKLTWTAFKFTEKTGVSGTFDKIEVQTKENSEEMLQTLAGATFSISVEKINSDNPDRDMKIQTSFFGAMDGTQNISGEILSIDENEAIVEIKMNGVTQAYAGKIAVSGEKINFNTTIDMLDFDAQNAVDSLNKVCNDLHKGADGISKLWSEVDIEIETEMVRECK